MIVWLLTCVAFALLTLAGLLVSGGRGATLKVKPAKCADIVRKHVSYELIAEAARMEATK